MTSAPIEATYVESAEYFAEAYGQIPRVRPWVHYLIAPFVGVLPGLQSFLNHDRHWPLFFLIGVGIYLCVTSKTLQQWNLKRNYRKMATNPNQGVKWEFREEEILQFTPTASTRFAWAYIIRVIQTKDGVLLEDPNRQYFWIARRYLHSENAYEELTNLLKRKVSRFEVR